MSTTVEPLERRQEIVGCARVKFALALDSAKRKRRYAHYLMRAARRDNFYALVGIKNPMAVEAKFQMQEAMRFLWQAKDILAAERHAQAMRELWGHYEGDRRG